MRKELRLGKLAGLSIYWSGVTEPYAASPGVTRDYWKAMIATKSSLRPKIIAIQTRMNPTRDIDQIVKYIETSLCFDDCPPVVVSYSIGTDRQDIIDSWEMRTPSFVKRMEYIKKTARTRSLGCSDVEPTRAME